MLETIDRDPNLIIKFPARMDTFKSQEVEEEIYSKVKYSTKKIVFDLDGVMYISSYFLRVCLNTVKAVGSERFAIQNARADIKKVFVIAGFDRQINIK